MQTATQATTSNDLTIYTDPKQAPKLAAGQRMITARFRNPARSATVLISDLAWQTMNASVPAAYAGLLAAVLETACKSILSKRLENMISGVASTNEVSLWYLILRTK